MTMPRRTTAQPSFRPGLRSLDVQYEEKVFTLIFLTVLLAGIVTAQVFQHMRFVRPLYIPRPEARKVAEVLLREPEPIKPLEEKAAPAKPEPPPRPLTPEEKKKLTSPPPLSAVGSPKALPEQPKDVKKMVARKGLLGLISKESGDADLRAYHPSKKRDVSEELDKALQNLSQSKKAGDGDDDFLGVGNLPEVAKKGSDIGYILQASKIGEVRESQVQFYGGVEDLPEASLRTGPQTEETVTGKGRSPYDIRKVVASYLGGLRYLYNKELRTNPTLRGKVTVSFEISPSGQVTRSSLVSSTLGSPSLEQAVLANILKWRFPSIPEENGTTQVTWPFVFVPPSS